MERIQTLRSLEILIGMAERMKNAYLWHAPQSACARREYETRHTIKPIKWQEGGHEYSAELVVKCSCARIYVVKNYFRDGDKVTLKAIKNSYRRMVGEK